MPLDFAVPLWLAAAFPAIVACAVTGFVFRRNSRRIVTVLAVGLLASALNPAAHVLVLGPLDKIANDRLLARFSQEPIIGMTSMQVIDKFGTASRIENVDGSIVDSSTQRITGYAHEPVVIWYYVPMPFYYLGQSTKVFFHDGIVSSYEPAD